VLGELAVKMPRYKQQFTFSDAAKLNNAVHFINLSPDLIERRLQGVLEEISRRVEAATAGIVVVDSFRNRVARRDARGQGDGFTSLHAAAGATAHSSEATTFLIGAYSKSEPRDNPVFTVADGLFWLFQ
jgi:circadian clock protein KaiC